mmetsp:Transcript_19710/g.40000  ORF Transcript_19710/g.40000 Transcript_19710/m.40000 type:complete len:234 (+) Transcript_19710:490-1191(+)
MPVDIDTVDDGATDASGPSMAATAQSSDDPFDNLSVQTGDFSKVSEFTMERDDRVAATAAAAAAAGVGGGGGAAIIDEESAAEEAKTEISANTTGTGGGTMGTIDSLPTADTGTGSPTKQEVIKERAQAVVGKAREASSTVIKSVVSYEQEHHFVGRVLEKAQTSARFVAGKVKECTSPAAAAASASASSRADVNDVDGMEGMVATAVEEHDDVAGAVPMAVDESEGSDAERK